MMGLTVQVAGGVAVMTFTLPALGFAVGSAVFERPPVRWEAVGPPDQFPDDTYLPRVITTVPGIGEVGKTTVYIRAHNPKIDGAKDPNIPYADEQRRRLRGAVHALHAPGLPGPLRRRVASASSARATAASTTSPARSPVARRCARSTASTSACATASSRSGRATRSTPSSSASRATAIPAQDARRHRPVPVPRPLLDPEDGVTAELDDAQAPGPADPEDAATPGRSGRTRPSRRVRSTSRRKAGSPPSTGSTSAPRCPVRSAG